MSVKKIKTCQNHLAELYEAIQKQDLSTLTKVEHELSYTEECVACAYIFKSKGTVKEALESYLEEEGFDVKANADKLSKKSLIVKASVFFFSFLLVFLLDLLIRKIFLGKGFLVIQNNMLELALVSIISVGLFIIIDSFLFD